MLTEDQRPPNSVARAAKPIWDVTERMPIPRGATVDIQDFDSCADSTGLWVVEYRRRIYLAAPDELRL